MAQLFSGLVSWHEIEILGRLLMAALLGGIVGWERERSGKVAGLRTHTLVSLGAALFTTVSLLIYVDLPSVTGAQGYSDRIIANIIVGIGFIGAGAILRRDDRVEGTTTAASLWVVAAIGLAAGLGYYREAIATTALAYLTLTGLWMLEKNMRKSIHYRSTHKKKIAEEDID